MNQCTLFDRPPEIVQPPSSVELLRHYQRDVLERGRRQIAKGRKRGIIQGETGCGKTHVEAEIARCAVEKGKRCLIMGDRRKLIKQIGNTLHKFNVDYGVIMDGETCGTYKPAICGSRDTLQSWIKRELTMPDPFDIIIIDECHKAMGTVYQDLLKLWPNAVSIGFTATPALGDGSHLSGYYKWIECTVSASHLIKEGWLLKPEVYVPLELAKRRSQGKRPKNLAGNPVEHWRRHALDLPTIAFAENIVESVALCERFLKDGIAAEHIDASTSDEEREKCYERLRCGQTKILCSVGLLIEGIDIPEVSCALLWKKFGSIVQYRQAAGRIMRPAPWAGKTRCVVLDHGGASGEHGLPGDDIEWSLDSEETVGDRRKKAIANGLDPGTACPKCGYFFFNTNVCPSCNWKKPEKKKSSGQAEASLKLLDEVLALYDGIPSEQFHAQRAQETFLRTFKRCLHIAAYRNGSYKMVSFLFKKYAGKYPSQAGIVEPPAHQWHLPVAQIYPDLLRDKT